jgi:uncharacterized phage protein (TIGR01671 family)
MKREIKFRTWDEEEKKMYALDIFKTEDDSYGPEFVLRTKESQDAATWIDTHCKESDCILMQFTGLKDKNGKEIYEGDILEFKNIDNIGEVAWCFFDSAWGLKVNDEFTNVISTYLVSPYEVIGNIYENPELLKS